MISEDGLQSEFFLTTRTGYKQVCTLSEVSPSLVHSSSVCRGTIRERSVGGVVFCGFAGRLGGNQLSQAGIETGAALPVFASPHTVCVGGI